MVNTFYNLNHHLLQDEAPSQYVSQISGLPFFKEYPYIMLYKLKETQQSPVHHPEGSVWQHTMLVLDHAASVKNKSHNPRILMWAALLHDIGKPDTTILRKGRITCYGHDKKGYELAKEFLHALTDDVEFIEDTAGLVRWHMQMLFVLKNLPFMDIQCMKKNTDVHEVGLLGFCDRIGRLHTNRQEEEKNLLTFLQIYYSRE